MLSFPVNLEYFLTDGRTEGLNVEKYESQQLPRLALLALAVPRDWPGPTVLLAICPRHALLADPAALAVGVDATAEDVAELAVFAVPAEVPTVLTLSRDSVAGTCGYVVAAKLEGVVVGGDPSGEEEEEEGKDREQGPAGHCDNDKTVCYVMFGLVSCQPLLWTSVSTWHQM